VTRLELDKQIKPLDEFQRAGLIERLFELGETREMIQRRADSVMVKDTYGTIAFQYWVEDLVCVWSSAMARQRQIREQTREWVDHEIKKRIEHLKKLTSEEQRKVDVDVVELAALEEAKVAWKFKLGAIMERKRTQYARRFAFAKKALAGLDRDARVRVLDEAVRQEIIKDYDESMIAEIHLFPDKLYRVVEAMSKEQG